MIHIRYIYFYLARHTYSFRGTSVLTSKRPATKRIKPFVDLQYFSTQECDLYNDKQKSIKNIFR